MEEIVLDPTTQEVWLKVPVAEDGLHAVLSKSRSFQETVRRGRNTVTVGMDVNFSLELERGEGGEGPVIISFPPPALCCASIGRVQVLSGYGAVLLPLCMLLAFGFMKHTTLGLSISFSPRVPG